MTVEIAVTTRLRDGENGHAGFRRSQGIIDRIYSQARVRQTQIEPNRHSLFLLSFVFRENRVPLFLKQTLAHDPHYDFSTGAAALGEIERLFDFPKRKDRRDMGFQLACFSKFAD